MMGPKNAMLLRYNKIPSVSVEASTPAGEAGWAQRLAASPVLCCMLAAACACPGPFRSPPPGPSLSHHAAAAPRSCPPLRPPQSPYRRVRAGYLAQRSAVITPQASALIVGALQEIGMIDSRGWLVADPKDFDVRVLSRVAV